MSDFPTGNATRDGVIVTVLQEAKANNDPITFANIGLQCDQYGDRLNEPTRSAFKQTWAPLTEGEFADAVAYMAAADAGAALLNGSTEAETVEPVETEQPAQPEISRDEAQELVRLAAENTFNARRDLQEAEHVRKAILAEGAAAILAWQNGGRPPMTRDELIRETLRSNQMERERNADNIHNQQRAFTTKQFVQKQMRTGKHRGSVDLVTLQHMRARVIREKAAAEAAKGQG